MSRHLFRYTLLALTLASAGVAQADTWKAISGKVVYDDPRYADPTGIQGTFAFGGDYFVDGMYSPSQKSLVMVRADLVGNPAPGVTLSFSGASSGSNGVLPPQVDLAGMRADFSSLLWTGWYSYTDGRDAIGGLYGTVGWVPIVDNLDGTYSATWRMSSIPQGAGTFSLTFAHVSAVPEAAMPAYLLAGLGMMAFIRRRRA